MLEQKEWVEITCHVVQANRRASARLIRPDKQFPQDDNRKSIEKRPVRLRSSNMDDKTKVIGKKTLSQDDPWLHQTSLEYLQPGSRWTKKQMVERK